MSAPDNPAAFPLAMTSESMDNHGMSMRDWFAGQALAGMYANPHIGMLGSDATAAVGAYRIADAMLAEREKRSAGHADMQHVAYFDEGEFHWMSGIKPRACELYAKARGAQS